MQRFTSHEHFSLKILIHNKEAFKYNSLNVKWVEFAPPGEILPAREINKRINTTVLIVCQAPVVEKHDQDSIA